VKTNRKCVQCLGLGLHGYVLVDERALFVGVALDTNRVPAGHSPHLPEGGSAVDVMATSG